MVLTLQDTFIQCSKLIDTNDYRKDLMENSGLKEGVVYKL
jgi:hypothetical protein